MTTLLQLPLQLRQQIQSLARSQPVHIHRRQPVHDPLRQRSEHRHLHRLVRASVAATRFAHLLRLRPLMQLQHFTRPRNHSLGSPASRATSIP